MHVIQVLEKALEGGGASQSGCPLTQSLATHMRIFVGRGTVIIQESTKISSYQNI